MLLSSAETRVSFIEIRVGKIYLFIGIVLGALGVIAYLKGLAMVFENWMKKLE